MLSAANRHDGAYDGVGASIQMEPVGKHEQANLRAGFGVVPVGDGVDDGLVDGVQLVRFIGAADRAGVERGLHELGNEGDRAVDLVGHRPSEALGMNQLIGGQALTWSFCPHPFGSAPPLPHTQNPGVTSWFAHDGGTGTCWDRRSVESARAGSFVRVDGPTVHHIHALDRSLAHGAGVVDAEEDDAALGIRERHQLARKFFRIGATRPRSPRRTSSNSARPSSPARN